MYILAGSDHGKINQTISKSVKKYSFQEINFILGDENFSEILGTINTESLFGDRNLYVVDVTETDPELIEKFLDQVKEVKDLYIVYKSKLDSRTKLAKKLQSFGALVFDDKREVSPFKFGDLVVSKEFKSAYEEMIFLEKEGIEPISLFSGITTSMRNILNIKFNTKARKAIFPSKISFYEKIAKNLTEEEVKNLYSKLAENDLKFKKGQIDEKMLIMSSMNIFFSNKE